VKISFVGAGSTGKTTLATWVSRHYQIPLLGSAARDVAARFEKSLDDIRMEPAVNDDYQWQVFQEQIKREHDHTNFVSDRAFDSLCYSCTHAHNASKIFHSEAFYAYLRSLQKPDRLIFYVRPHRELLTTDAFRSGSDLTWEAMLRFDGQVQAVLEMLDVRYFQIDCLTMRDRVRLVKNIVSLHQQATRLMG
jgi:hypothetical protein